MSYLLTGFIAEHFRATGNEWQTLGELVEATGRPRAEVSREVERLKREGQLTKKGKRRNMAYRVPAELLHALVPKKEKRSLQQITKDFCKKYGVTHPYQATRRSESALNEWLTLTGNRA